MTYACHSLNVTVSPGLGGITPVQALTRQVPDISFLLHFTFWEPVYYKVDQSEPKSCFHSDSNENCGHWVGLLKTKGIDSFGSFSQMIPRRFSSCPQSALPSALPPTRDSICCIGRLTSLPTFLYDATSSHEVSGRMPTINFDDLLGRTFLLPDQ